MGGTRPFQTIALLALAALAVVDGQKSAKGRWAKAAKAKKSGKFGLEDVIPDLPQPPEPPQAPPAGLLGAARLGPVHPAVPLADKGAAAHPVASVQTAPPVAPPTSPMASVQTTPPVDPPTAGAQPAAQPAAQPTDPSTSAAQTNPTTAAAQTDPATTTPPPPPDTTVTDTTGAVTETQTPSTDGTTASAQTNADPSTTAASTPQPPETAASAGNSATDSGAANGGSSDASASAPSGVEDEATPSEVADSRSAGSTMAVLLVLLALLVVAAVLVVVKYGRQRGWAGQEFDMEYPNLKGGSDGTSRSYGTWSSAWSNDEPIYSDYELVAPAVPPRASLLRQNKLHDANAYNLASSTMGPGDYCVASASPSAAARKQTRSPSEESVYEAIGDVAEPDVCVLYSAGWPTDRSPAKENTYLLASGGSKSRSASRLSSRLSSRASSRASLRATTRTNSKSSIYPLAQPGLSTFTTTPQKRPRKSPKQTPRIPTPDYDATYDNAAVVLPGEVPDSSEAPNLYDNTEGSGTLRDRPSDLVLGALSDSDVDVEDASAAAEESRRDVVYGTLSDSIRRAEAESIRREAAVAAERLAAATPSDGEEAPWDDTDDESLYSSFGGAVHRGATAALDLYDNTTEAQGLKDAPPDLVLGDLSQSDEEL